MSGPFVPTGGEPPRSMIYIAMPNAKDPVTLPLLANGYVVGPEQRFESDGYAVSVYRLERRSSDEEAASVSAGAANGRPPR